MLIKQRDQFLFKCHLTVVFLLVFDISQNCIHPWIWYRKRGVPILPTESFQISVLFMNPARGTGLYFPQTIWKICLRMERCSQMQVVSRSVCRQQTPLLVAQYTANVSAYRLNLFFVKICPSFFRRKDNMIVQTCIRHSCLSMSPRRGLYKLLASFPGVPPPSIVFSPFGTNMELCFYKRKHSSSIWLKARDQKPFQEKQKYNKKVGIQSKLHRQLLI